MSQKVIVDQNKCIGCQTCAQIDPQVFALNQKTFKVKVVSQKTTPQTKSAIDSCPVNAISINKN